METLQKSSLYQDTERMRTIKADVIFGSPAKKCAGIGICQVSPYRSEAVERKVPCCQRVETDIALAPASDRLHFIFPRSKICKKMISQQFAYSRFRITEELALPAWLREQFGLPEGRLVAAVYPVIFHEESIEVSIRIR